MEPIQIKIGEESYPVIEEAAKFDTSIFSSVYTKAKELINTYLETLQAGKPKNNIIGFVGDRGSGKTSCMLSVKEALIKGEKEWGAGTRFLEIEMIDPSFFEEDCNILELILAKFFVWFKEQTLKEELGGKNTRIGRYYWKRSN
ncbi:MAG: hypothetical protein LUG51_08785 [Tannerellaceae bacterium]|nr:hypothetical protein [Tannerellaceae bacterium]